jgi:hypothetical protein
VSELPFLETALLDAARRRTLRRRRRPVAGVAVAVAAVAAILVLRSGSAPERSASAPPATRWTTFVTAGDLRLSLPAGWHLAPRTLTPHLTDPKEQFSAGTFPLVYRKGHCNHQPDGALRRMTSRDAFVTLQERAGGSSAGFPPRPASFEQRARADDTDFAECLQGRPDLSTFWLPFSDKGHNLYALVVIGRDAPARVQAETFAILDLLRFERRRAS